MSEIQAIKPSEIKNFLILMKEEGWSDSAIRNGLLCFKHGILKIEQYPQTKIKDGVFSIHTDNSSTYELTYEFLINLDAITRKTGIEKLDRIAAGGHKDKILNNMSIGIQCIRLCAQTEKSASLREFALNEHHLPASIAKSNLFIADNKIGFYMPTSNPEASIIWSKSYVNEEELPQLMSKLSRHEVIS